MDPIKLITSPIARVGAVAQNALEVARFGGLETDEEPSPYEVISEHPVFRLRRYFADSHKPGDRPPVVLVPPMMLAAEVFDVAPPVSAVRVLHESGVDPWVVDFGAPDQEEGGLERTLTDHVLAVSEVVDRVRAATGRDIHIGGYSQGGMFCYQTAAYRRCEGIESVITFGSPVDISESIPLGLPVGLVSRAADLLGSGMVPSVPAWMSRTGFRMLDPVKSLRSRISFVRQLHDREALLPRERQRRFLEAEGWVAWPGPALAELLRQFVAHNRMLQGGFVIEGRLVTLADIDCPVLSFVGEVDEIAPPSGVRAIVRAAPRSEVYEVSLRAGHFGLVVGSTAARESWPLVSAWASWRDGKGELPAEIARVTDGNLPEPAAPARDRLGYGLGLAGNVGAGLAKSAGGTLTRTVRNVRSLSRDAASQLPRLARLERIEADTRVSLGALLDEQARKSPDEVLFLFEDRAYTREAAKGRIDAIVRGLIAIGVHQGDHVGVLMATRPTALAVIAALSRLGAVAVLMRPDGDHELEAKLGELDRVIADPEHAELPQSLGSVHTFVLGGGAEPRDLGALTDMERIDPDEVPLPAWFEANPGRAGDLAFMVFTGEGSSTRVSRITNRRWALSAFGTASSAALTSADTVYSVTPIYHPSGLLMSIGGAIAGGARLAMASSFDPATFWDEVRRYGVTVASYTWTLLHDLAEAPAHPGERHHPVRLFIGSGMPRGLWRRVAMRFAPARVLEFYASSEGDAILVNLTGVKAGALGRPLPGSAEVRVIDYDIEARVPILGGDGLARECEVGEAGMLISRRPPNTATEAMPLRGVFESGDAWLETGDLFRRDSDGDHWLVDHLPAMIHTETGYVASQPLRDAIGDLPAVDLAIAYGVAVGDQGFETPVVALTLRAGRELTGQDIRLALSSMPQSERPGLVRVVEEIPVTTWFRPITAPLRAQGIPAVGDRQAWVRDGESYVELDDEARSALVDGRTAQTATAS